jgi:hypothetical protein
VPDVVVPLFGAESDEKPQAAIAPTKDKAKVRPRQVT